jgi:hypothetical protein
MGFPLDGRIPPVVLDLLRRGLFAPRRCIAAAANGSKPYAAVQNGRGTMESIILIILLVVFFVLSFFLKGPRMGLVLAIVCAALSAYFIVLVFIQDSGRHVPFIFALLSIFLTMKQIRNMKSPRNLDEKR